MNKEISNVKYKPPVPLSKMGANKQGTKKIQSTYDVPGETYYDLKNNKVQDYGNYEKQLLQSMGLSESDYGNKTYNESKIKDKYYKNYGPQNFLKRYENDKEFLTDKGEWKDDFSEANARKKWFSNLGEEKRQQIENQIAKENETRLKIQQLKQANKDATQAEKEYNRLVRIGKWRENPLLKPIADKMYKKKQEIIQPSEPENLNMKMIQQNMPLIKQNKEKFKKQGIDVDEVLKNPHHPQLATFLQLLRSIIIR